MKIQASRYVYLRTLVKPTVNPDRFSQTSGMLARLLHVRQERKQIILHYIVFLQYSFLYCPNFASTFKFLLSFSIYTCNLCAVLISPKRATFRGFLSLFHLEITYNKASRYITIIKPVFLFTKLQYCVQHLFSDYFNFCSFLKFKAH